MSNRVIRPSFHDDIEEYRPKKSHKGDELSTISFESLNSAQDKIRPAASKRLFESTPHGTSRNQFARDLSDLSYGYKKNKFEKVSRKSKHAPSESSSKRPVSKVREIQGLNLRGESTLHTDIRFDPAYGEADLSRTRKDYAFLDEYRQSEIGSMEKMLKDRKSTELLGEREVGDLKFKLQSLKSRLDTMKNKDLETQILADHKKQQLLSFKSGAQTHPYFLKRSDQRKLVQKAKFDTMKGSQREKVMERKRKRRLGKEFKRMEFNEQP